MTNSVSSRPKYKFPLVVPVLPLLAVMASPLGAAPKSAAPKAAPATTKAAPATIPAPSKATSNGEYLLGPEDVLDVTVSNHPDLNVSVTVRPDGRITLPRAGELNARGKSARALAREIQSRLSRTLNNARVQVLVKQARPRMVRVIGAVKTAGTFPLSSGAHVLDLVAQAGGLSTKISRVSGRIIRAGAVVPFDLSLAQSHPGSAANVALLPDDLMVLDAQDFAKQITVTGSVAHPGAYDLEEDLSVVGLLAQAGGPLPSAALRGAQILRAGKPVLSDLSAVGSTDLPANSPLARFRFQAGDVLLVPENTARFGVMGQVVRPAYYQLSETASNATVLKALSEAGGSLADGDLSAVTITRTKGGKTEVIPLDANLLMQGKVPDTLILQSDDVLLVPKKKEKSVSVTGQVLKPGAFPLGDDLTLLSLLAAAGNPSPGAGLSRAYVLREGKQLPINLRPALVEHHVDDAVSSFKLQDGDVLVVPDVRDQVQVIGQVAKPGPYALGDDLTMMSLLSQSGVATDAAALSQAYVLRGRQRIGFDLRSTMQGNIDAAVLNFRFEPGDVLVVPENPARLAIIGAVLHPGPYPFPENPADASVLKLLTTAGGPVNGGGEGGADLGKASIIRARNGQQTVIPINIADLLKTGKTPQSVQLQPNDILYIPSKKSKSSVLEALGPLSLLTTIFR